MGDLVRCFLSARLDSAVTKRLEREIGFFQLAGADVKWVPRQNLHLTVRFLGELEPEALMEVEELVEEAVESAAKCRPMVRGIRCFPNDERPRVIAAGFEGDLDPIQNLFKDLQGRLRVAGVRPDKKDYTPHVTLGRVRGDRHLPELQDRIRQSHDRRFGMTSIDRLDLMMSDVGPKGPIYTVLRDFRLT